MHPPISLPFDVWVQSFGVFLKCDDKDVFLNISTIGSNFKHSLQEEVRAEACDNADRPVMSKEKLRRFAFCKILGPTEIGEMRRGNPT